MEQNRTDTVLLVMDMQSTILKRLPDTTDLIGSVKKAIGLPGKEKFRLFMSSWVSDRCSGNQFKQ